MTAQDYVQQLRLTPHPEGGYYRQVYVSGLELPAYALPGRGGPRAASTAIYFLLAAGQISRLHRIASDEVWHFYAGDALTIYVLHPNGQAEMLTLGPDVGAGQAFQQVVPAGCWFGAEPRMGDYGFTLVGCTVAPGFHFDDFELAAQPALLTEFPQHRDLIRKLT